MALLEGTTLTLIITAVLIILLCYFLSQQYFHKLPPGPRGLPYLGCFPWMTHDWHNDFERLGKGYGDMFTVWLLNTPVVVFQGWKAIEEAFDKQIHVFCNRPVSHGFLQQGVPPSTLFKTHLTDKFKSRKKFLMGNVKKYSFSNRENADKIQDEVDSIITMIKSKNSKPFLLQKAIRIHAANPIPILFFGKAYEHNDKYFENVMDNSCTWFGNMAMACEADVLPILRFFPRKCVPIGKKAAAELIDYFKKSIQECREAYDPNCLRCFVDQCIKAGDDDHEIMLHLLSYWGDATDSVQGGVRLWIHLLATYPEVQKKTQEELDTALGDRSPSLSDRLDLPYLEATILEVLRVTSPVPISLPQETLIDTEIMGYKIPRGTKYMINFSTAHKDPSVWKEPEKFNPDRFITKDGKCDYKHPGWCAYGIGRRMCLGEPLSRQLMYLFAANLSQKFTFSFPPDDVPPRDPLELACGGVTNIPRDFKVIATPRDE